MMTKKLLHYIFFYETEKVVQIQSFKIGILFRLIQVAIILYIIFWVMIEERGYQAVDHAVSGVTAILQGVSFMAEHDVVDTNGQTLWDPADYVVPPQQNSAFFVTTNLVSTPHQVQGICDESADVYGVRCATDGDCARGQLIMLGSGRMTGRCVNSTQVAGAKVCEIFGWCPTENDVLPFEDRGLIINAPNFTVMLQCSIEFPRYQVKLSNILPWMTEHFLYTCRYSPHHPTNKYCPVFRLGDILDHADSDSDDIWIKGGMVSINIAWVCNLDFHKKHCVPKYSFRRLDNRGDPVAKGSNFRYSYKYTRNGTEHRTLVKAYGIQFFINVHGRGYRFEWYTFTMNVGSGIGLLGIATIICDLIILNLVHKRRHYKSAKTVVMKTVETQKLKSPTSSPNKQSNGFFTAGSTKLSSLFTRSKSNGFSTSDSAEIEIYSSYKKDNRFSTLDSTDSQIFPPTKRKNIGISTAISTLEPYPYRIKRRPNLKGETNRPNDQFERITTLCLL